MSAESSSSGSPGGGNIPGQTSMPPNAAAPQVAIEATSPGSDQNSPTTAQPDSSRPPTLATPVATAPRARRPLARAQSIFDNGHFVNQRGLGAAGRGAIPSAHVPLDKREVQRAAKSEEAREALLQAIVRKYRAKEQERLTELEKAGLLVKKQAPYVYVGCIDHRVTRRALAVHFENALRAAGSTAHVLELPDIRFANGNLCYTNVIFPNGYVSTDDTQYALVQFTDKEALPIALRMNGSRVNECKIMVTLSVCALPEMRRMACLHIAEVQGLARTTRSFSGSSMLLETTQPVQTKQPSSVKQPRTRPAPAAKKGRARAK